MRHVRVPGPASLDRENVIKRRNCVRPRYHLVESRGFRFPFRSEYCCAKWRARWKPQIYLISLSVSVIRCGRAEAAAAACMAEHFFAKNFHFLWTKNKNKHQRRALRNRVEIFISRVFGAEKCGKRFSFCRNLFYLVKRKMHTLGWCLKAAHADNKFCSLHDF